MRDKLSNFMCVGVQKACTTTLHDIFKQHSKIFLPKIKEIKFFQLDEKFDKGIEYYKNEFFRDLKEKKILGEIDSKYMYFRSKMINNLVHGKSFIGRFVERFIVSKIFQTKIISYIDFKNEEYFLYKKLSSKQKEILTNKYFENDMIKTSQLIGRDLLDWLRA